MMMCIKNRFFNQNRLLLLAFGLWFDEETIFTHFQATLLCSLMISSIIFQFSRLFIAECSFDLIMRIFSSMMFYVLLTIPCISMWINIKAIKYLFDQLQYIYDRLKDRNEIAIYDKYGYIGKQFTTVAIIVLAFSLCGNSVIIYWPYILDIIVPKNVSYAIRAMYFMTKYFKVSEKYYFLVLVHLNAACTTGLIVMIAMGTMLLSYTQHICGMFEIASYRIEQAMAPELLHNFDIKNRTVICKQMICAIDIQRQAMQLSDCLLSTMHGSLAVVIITTVLCASCNLFQVFQIESPAEELEEVLLHLLAASFVVWIMFICNYAGQEITDHSNHVYVITYSISWYLAPLHIQKLVLFLLQRNHKIFTMSVAGLFTASLECFATLVSASVSYFTFMYSMQK
ncbi:hypothetical protein DMN91_003849 [Ooceraea biroi]|uniref:Odorant receptor n=2 Tax=Ooceraea biroi TaxID=2015173 RepID=A0A3L8DTZ9_OOCBI|nr:hypothetical protein DMN91_003849 [Ooceraea biroi]